MAFASAKHLFSISNIKISACFLCNSSFSLFAKQIDFFNLPYPSLPSLTAFPVQWCSLSISLYFSEHFSCDPLPSRSQSPTVCSRARSWQSPPWTHPGCRRWLLRGSSHPDRLDKFGKYPQAVQEWFCPFGFYPSPKIAKSFKTRMILFRELFKMKTSVNGTRIWWIRFKLKVFWMKRYFHSQNRMLIEFRWVYSVSILVLFYHFCLHQASICIWGYKPI